jgi:hypothetical protein
VSSDELGADLRPDQFVVENLPDRPAAVERDPWSGFESKRASADRAVKQIVR